MANRILLDESGLKISRPGVDVLVASPANLQFRSDATNVPRFLVGSVTGSQSQNWNGGTAYNFGRTFTTVPMVSWSRHRQGEVVNSTGTLVNEGENLGFNSFSWAVIIERSRLLFNSQTDSVLYFKVWDFEA